MTTMDEEIPKFSDLPDEGLPAFKDLPSEEPPSELSWSDVPGKALSNVPSSAGNFVSSLVQPFIHPVATAVALKNIGQGALEKTGMLNGHEHEEHFNAVGKFLMDRYGSVNGIKNTIASDPVGLAADLSMILTGGETAAARLPGIAGELTRAAGTAGRAINPINVAAQAARVPAKIGAESIGLLTGTGARPLEAAAAAGYEGGEAARAFRGNMRGQVPMENVVQEAKTAVEHMRAQRGADYRAGMADVGLDKTVLNFNDVNDALSRMNEVKVYKGQSLSPSTEAVRTKIADEVKNWQQLNPADFHTAEGFDALKQKIGDIRDATAPGTPERRAANEAYGAIRQTIINQVPDYAKVMKGYEQASSLTKEIEKTLSLPQDAHSGPMIDTSLRKLQSVLRNNVNTNYGRREKLAEYLINSGAPHLMEALAGHAVNSWVPRGLAQLGARLGVEATGAALGLGTIGAHAAAPLAATLPLMSPRLMGEASYYAGRLASPLRMVPGAASVMPAGRFLANAAPPQVTIPRQALPGEQRARGGKAMQDGGLASDDYDYQGAMAAGVTQDERGHWPDTYKLPNHITFSDESTYHDAQHQGGHWEQVQGNKWNFTPGPENFKHHSIQELQNYFREYEPDSRLILPQYARGGGIRKNGEKMTHSSVHYVMESPHRNKSCGLCSMFVPGGPACTLVQSPIASAGYCNRFAGRK